MPVADYKMCCTMFEKARGSLYDPKAVGACLALFRKGFALPNDKRKGHGAFAPETGLPT